MTDNGTTPNEQLRRARTGRRAELGDENGLIVATLAQLERTMQRLDARLTALEKLAQADDGGEYPGDELAARRQLGPVIDR